MEQVVDPSRMEHRNEKGLAEEYSPEKHPCQRGDPHDSRIDADSRRVRCAHARATRAIMKTNHKVPAGDTKIHFGPADR
ncbi:UNVERIFIED_CONTAM: hypothetical protein Slati_1761200 [Sesamum latifolium]|uniref:Uncharacterized protein n=1 Tax=Sesamum latifolium TaxID=2727402 RepID=A0AAW2WY23_9LAMI